MKSLVELETGECKFAMTESDVANYHWHHLRLGSSGAGVTMKGQPIGGAAYPHMFCAEAVQPGSVYCAAHHARCYRGPGKDARSLEEMMYATDHSQYRGRQPYADHTDPMDVELKQQEAA